MSYWLVKSEPSTFSIEKLKKDRKTNWDGVRNYQARNNMKAMKRGEKVLFYHSAADIIGIVGLAKVSKEAFPDPSQFDPKSDYFDSASTKDNPRWWCTELSFESQFKEILTLADLMKHKKLSKMPLLQKGSRLSVQPVSEDEFDYIMNLASE